MEFANEEQVEALRGVLAAEQSRVVDVINDETGELFALQMPNLDVVDNSRINRDEATYLTLTDLTEIQGLDIDVSPLAARLVVALEQSSAKTINRRDSEQVGKVEEEGEWA